MKLVTWRVSTDQLYFILGVVLDESFMTPEHAFHSHTLLGVKDSSEQDRLKTILRYHPKTLAYLEEVSRLKGRDHTKDVIVDEIRFPLPFKVQHRFASKADDPIFHGIKAKKKQNGVQFLHVELIGELIDGYSPMKGSLSTASVASVASIKSPPVVVGGPLSTLHDDDDDDDDDDDSDEDYTFMSVDDSQLEVDTLDGISVATSNWAEKTFSSNKTKNASPSCKKLSTATSQINTSSRKIRVKKSTALAIRTRSDNLTVTEGALSPLRSSLRSKRQKTGHSVSGSKRSPPKGLSSNGTVV
jgi:hypothetical protein